MNATRSIALLVVLISGNPLIYGGDVEKRSCKCIDEGGSCYKTQGNFLSSYLVNQQVALKRCDEECIDKKVISFLESERNRLGRSFAAQSYIIRCPCLCKDFCETRLSFFEKMDCPTTTTEPGKQHSSFSSKISTVTSHPPSTVEDHPTSDNGNDDFSSTSSKGTAIHTKSMPTTLTSNVVSTLAETSPKEVLTDVITLTASHPPQETGTTVTTTTVDGTTEVSAHPSQARLTTSTVRTDEPSTTGHLSTSEQSHSSTSDSIKSSTLRTTTDSIRTSGTSLPAPSSHATTDSSSWSSILIGKWTSTMREYETITSSSVYEKPSKTTTTMADWSTNAPTTTKTPTEASTSSTSFEKASQTPTRSQLEESTYKTTAYKTTTLQYFQTSSERATEGKTVSSSPTAAPSQGKPSTTIQDSTHKTSTSSDLQASSEASSEPATAPIYSATSSQGMGTSPATKLEESTHNTGTYPEQQESSEKASTATSAPSLLTTILGQGRVTSTTQLQETTTIYQGPQTTSEEASSGPAVPQTHTATFAQRTSTTPLPEESTSFFTSDTASLTPGEGPEITAEKLPIITSRITRYYQPGSSSRTPVRDQTTSSTVASSPYGTTIDKASSVTSTSYAEVYSPLTLLSTLLHRGDGATLTAMEEDAHETSSAPISEKVPSSYAQTELPYPSSTETPRISSVTSTTPTTSRFASSSESVKFKGTTLETTRFTDEETLETTSPTMKESETTANKFLYFTKARTQQGSGSVTTTSAPEEEATIKAVTTEAGQLTDSDEAETNSTLKSGNRTATSSISYSSRVPPESTTARSWECALPCPLTYMEGPNYCYRLLQDIRSTINYREAFHLCAVEEKGDMADEVDLRDGLVQQLLRNARYASNDIRCTKSDTEVVKVSCRQKGYLNPHPTRIACQEDRKLALLKKMRIRKSCKECYQYGTEKCVKVSGGFTCQCRTNWTEPTCWQAPDLCRINQVDCGENGRCVTELTKTRCICNSTFAGPNCAVNKTRLSFISDTEASFVSGTTAGASILVATGSVVLLVRGLLAFVYRGTSNDPQSYYQNLRCFFVSLAGLLSFLFRHPALLGISQIQCMVTAVMTTCCFTFGMAFFALEALTFYECASLRQLNSWTEPFWGRKRWYTSPAFRTLTPLLILAAAVIGAFKSNPKEAVSSWSCLGRFEPATRDFWFPIALAHSCLGLAALAFTLEGRFKRNNMPQFQQVVEEHLKALPPSRREEVEKLGRRVFTGLQRLRIGHIYIDHTAGVQRGDAHADETSAAVPVSGGRSRFPVVTGRSRYQAPTTAEAPKEREEATTLRQKMPGKQGVRPPQVLQAVEEKMDGPVQEAEREEREEDEGPSHMEDLPHEATGGPGARANQELPQADKVNFAGLFFNAFNRAEPLVDALEQLFCGWARKTYREDTQPDAVLKLKTRKRAEKEHYVPPEFCIPMCYASVVDSYGYTQLEEVMKTPAEEGLNLCQPSTSRQQEQIDDGGERGIAANQQNEEETMLEWIQELTDNTFKMVVQNHDYLERSISLREWAPL
ncbi:unnamed protein product [Nippostrongylus brasiliensis]|uniref:EGF-like domain-containing protein n=1 Tax=Nippostrongylus brasiliensis TaxID=27835 RepID=A0A0N4YDA3_NIPBR|nr:unnamed protein product [Nippostrongylus brasiliensis]